MTKVKSHNHTFDVHPNPKFADMCVCTFKDCGFAVSYNAFASFRRSMDFDVAYKNASPAVKAKIDSINLEAYRDRTAE